MVKKRPQYWQIAFSKKYFVAPFHLQGKLFVFLLIITWFNQVGCYVTKILEKSNQWIIITKLCWKKHWMLKRTYKYNLQKKNMSFLNSLRNYSRFSWLLEKIKTAVYFDLHCAVHSKRCKKSAFIMFAFVFARFWCTNHKKWGRNDLFLINQLRSTISNTSH